MKWWTVTLLYPDWSHWNGKGRETFHTWVRARGPRSAARAARKEMSKMNGDDDDFGRDAQVLTVHRGRCTDNWNTEWNKEEC